MSTRPKAFERTVWQLGRDPTVAFEQPAESLFTSNVAQTDRIGRTSLAILARWLHDKLVVESLIAAYDAWSNTRLHCRMVSR